MQARAHPRGGCRAPHGAVGHVFSVATDLPDRPISSSASSGVARRTRLMPGTPTGVIT